MSIQVKLFGPLVDAAGKAEIKIKDIEDTFSLKQEILCQYPAMKDFIFLISVNRKIVKENSTLKSGDEIALLPPFAGG
ncbi:MAG: MoaD/ThiS family protein [Bacteroidetes bacterium]|nr:MAG: MoaD/ThiS family protein [Bacteroidota bacterium]